MRFEFDDPSLEDLAYNPSARSPWPDETLDLYLRRLQQIDAVHTPDDLLAAVALDVRRVPRGDAEVLSLRIDGGHRLVVRLVKQEGEWTVLVLEVRAEHRGSTRGA